MKYLILLPLFLVSCSPTVLREIRYELKTEEDKKKCANLIVEICTAANPHSDEEGEDLVIQAEKTALKMYGKPVKYINRTDGKGWVVEE